MTKATFHPVAAAGALFAAAYAWDQTGRLPQDEQVWYCAFASANCIETLLPLEVPGTLLPLTPKRRGQLLLHAVGSALKVAYSWHKVLRAEQLYQRRIAEWRTGRMEVRGSGGDTLKLLIASLHGMSWYIVLRKRDAPLQGWLPWLNLTAVTAYAALHVGGRGPYLRPRLALMRWGELFLVLPQSLQPVLYLLRAIEPMETFERRKERAARWKGETPGTEEQGATRSEELPKASTPWRRLERLLLASIGALMAIPALPLDPLPDIWISARDITRRGWLRQMRTLLEDDHSTQSGQSE